MIVHLKFHDFTGFRLPYVTTLRLRSLVLGRSFPSYIRTTTPCGYIFNLYPNVFI